MHRRVEWMNPVDDSVLRFLGRTEAVLSPTCIARNVEYDDEYVGKRCRRMEEFGLLCAADDGYYRISDLGELYLDGDLDPAELAVPE